MCALNGRNGSKAATKWDRLAKLTRGFQKFGGINPQSASQSAQRTNGWISKSTLKLAYIASLHSRFERELLLRQSALLSESANVSTEQLDQVHAASSQRPVREVCPLIVT